MVFAHSATTPALDNASQLFPFSTMKLRVLLPTLFAFLLPAALSAATAKNCGCACCKGKEVCCCHAGDAADKPAADKPMADKPAADEKRYPLKGVVTDLYADRSALMVKHEEIPGYMRAMTMLFKVDAATLAAAKKGDAITGTLIKRGKEFWLEDYKVVAP